MNFIDFGFTIGLSVLLDLIVGVFLGRVDAVVTGGAGVEVEASVVVVVGGVWCCFSAADDLAAAAVFWLLALMKHSTHTYRLFNIRIAYITTPRPAANRLAGGLGVVI